MALRGAEAWDHLRLKAQMVEGDHNAVFSNGSVLPIFMRTVGNTTQLFVELEHGFFDPQQVPGFVRLQKQPDAPPPRVVPEALGYCVPVTFPFSEQ